MKRKTIIIKKNNIFFIMLILCLMSGCELRVIAMAKKGHNASKVEILYDSSDGIFKNMEYAVRIHFINGGSLEVHDVNEYGKGNLEISYVDGYSVVVGDKITRSVPYKTRMKVWSVIAQKQLETITDIVDSYNVISLYVKNVPNVYDYRTKDEIEVISKGAKPETFRKIDSEVTGRLIAENTFSYVVFEGREYYVEKYDKEDPHEK